MSTDLKKTIGIYGKHPAAADFIRLGANPRSVGTLDTWISEALVVAQRRLSTWPQSYDTSPPIAFLWNHLSGPSLIGVIAPSRDEIGRRFPLIVFSEAVSDTVLPSATSEKREVHPLADLPLSRFLETAEELLRTCSGDATQALEDGLGRLSGTEKTALRTHDDDAVSLLRQAASANAFSEMFGSRGATFVQNALSRAMEIEASIGNNASHPRYTIGCPLNDATDRAAYSTRTTKTHAAFWLAYLMRRAPATLRPCLLWTPDKLLIHCTKLLPNSLMALWDDRWHSESYCNLASQDAPSRALPKLAGAQTLWDLCRSL